MFNFSALPNFIKLGLLYLLLPMTLKQNVTITFSKIYRTLSTDTDFSLT